VISTFFAFTVPVNVASRPREELALVLILTLDRLMLEFLPVAKIAFDPSALVVIFASVI
jgi:hypothetical protein